MPRPGRASRAAASPADPRARVFEAVALGIQSFPEHLPESIDETGLAPRDAALAHTIVEGTVRHWLTLEYLVGGFLSRSPRTLDVPVAAALLGGACQLLFLDRVPPHAAIDTAVEWAKQRARPQAAGLVNAVLRRIDELVTHAGASTRQRRPTWSGAQDEIPTSTPGAIVLARPVLPADPVERISVATGTPRWLTARWIDRFGPVQAAALAHHGLVIAPTILNVSRVDPAAAAAPHLTPHESPGSAVMSGGRAELVSLLSSRTDLWVQDSSSAIAIASVAELRPRVVVDLCAGRGTKTRQLAVTFPDAEIVAADPDPERARVLAGLPRHYPNVRVESSESIARSLAGRADLVLLDVPCSNTGVLARRIAARHRAGDAQLQRLTEIQRSILRGARPLLAPGGAIVYSTCSLEPEENEHAVATARDLGLTPHAQRLTLPSGIPGDSPTRYRDGAYSAVFRA